MTANGSEPAAGDIAPYWREVGLTYELDSETILKLNSGQLDSIELLELKLLGYPAQQEGLSTAIPLTVVLALILLTGCIGNLCTAIVIAKPKNKYMHTATNYYLFSLAMSDFMLLILGLPLEIFDLWQKWPYIFSESFCVIRGYLSETSTYASILTISAFTIERYVAICHPLWAHTMSQLPRAITTIVIIWCLAALSAVAPAAELGIITRQGPITNRTIENSAMCHRKRSIYENMFAVSGIVFFLIPMIIVTVLYILIAIELRRSRKMNGAFIKKQQQQNQQQQQQQQQNQANFLKCFNQHHCCHNNNNINNPQHLHHNHNHIHSCKCHVQICNQLRPASACKQPGGHKAQRSICGKLEQTNNNNVNVNNNTQLLINDKQINDDADDDGSPSLDTKGNDPAAAAPATTTTNLTQKQHQKAPSCPLMAQIMSGRPSSAIGNERQSSPATCVLIGSPSACSQDRKGSIWSPFSWSNLLFASSNATSVNLGATPNQFSDLVKCCNCSNPQHWSACCSCCCCCSCSCTCLEGQQAGAHLRGPKRQQSDQLLNVASRDNLHRAHCNSSAQLSYHESLMSHKNVHAHSNKNHDTFNLNHNHNHNQNHKSAKAASQSRCSYESLGAPPRNHNHSHKQHNSSIDSHASQQQQLQQNRRTASASSKKSVIRMLGARFKHERLGRRSQRAPRSSVAAGRQRPLGDTATATARRPAGMLIRKMLPLASSSLEGPTVSFAVVVSFFICWLPFHAQRVLASYLSNGEQHYSFLYEIHKQAFYISGVMYYLSPTINPILYQLMSAKFRLAFKETFKCSLFKCLNNSGSGEHQDGSRRASRHTITTNATSHRHPQSNHQHQHHLHHQHHHHNHHQGQHLHQNQHHTQHHNHRHHDNLLQQNNKQHLLNSADADHECNANHHDRQMASSNSQATIRPGTNQNEQRQPQPACPGAPPTELTRCQSGHQWRRCSNCSQLQLQYTSSSRSNSCRCSVQTNCADLESMGGVAGPSGSGWWWAGPLRKLAFIFNAKKSRFNHRNGSSQSTSNYCNVAQQHQLHHHQSVTVEPPTCEDDEEEEEDQDYGRDEEENNSSTIEDGAACRNGPNVPLLASTPTQSQHPDTRRSPEQIGAGSSENASSSSLFIKGETEEELRPKTNIIFNKAAALDGCLELRRDELEKLILSYESDDYNASSAPDRSQSDSNCVAPCDSQRQSPSNEFNQDDDQDDKELLIIMTNDSESHLKRSILDSDQEIAKTNSSNETTKSIDLKNRNEIRNGGTRCSLQYNLQESGEDSEETGRKDDLNSVLSSPSIATLQLQMKGCNISSTNSNRANKETTNGCSSSLNSSIDRQLGDHCLDKQSSLSQSSTSALDDVYSASFTTTNSQMTESLTTNSNKQLNSLVECCPLVGPKLIQIDTNLMSRI